MRQAREHSSKTVAATAGNPQPHPHPQPQSQPQPRALQLVPALVFVVLTLLCLLFTLGAFGPPFVQVTDKPDQAGNTYTGLQNPANAQFVGPVKIVFANQEIYEGDFSKNRFNGSGKFTGIYPRTPEVEEATAPPETWTIQGNFIDGRLVGQGSYQDAEGSYYGSFENSLPHGQGVYTSASGWRYEGNFTMGAMTGQGTVYSEDGTVYEGEWLSGVLAS